MGIKRDLQLGILVAAITGAAAYPTIQRSMAGKSTTSAAVVPKAVASSQGKPGTASPVIVSPSIPVLENKQSADSKSALTDVVPDGFILPDMKQEPAATKLTLPKDEAPKKSAPEELKPPIDKSKVVNSVPSRPTELTLPALGKDDTQKSEPKIAKSDPAPAKKSEPPIGKTELPLPKDPKESKRELAAKSEKEDSQDRNPGELLLRGSQPAKGKKEGRAVTVESYDIPSGEVAGKNASHTEIEKSAKQPTPKAPIKGRPAHPYFQRYLEEGEYYVREDDSLKLIAFRLYSDESRAEDIARANPQVDAQKPLKPGIRLKLPKN